MPTGHAQRFWDERAREDAFFFVDNREPFGAADLERFWENGERDLNRILETLDVAVTSSDAVVDIGCGVGRLTRVLAARARTVHALDVSQEMLAQARQHNPNLANVTWIHGDGHSLRPLAGGAFDACVSHVVFQHIPDPAITLGYVREIGRVLRPNGWAAFQISNDPSVHQRRCGPRNVRSLVQALARRGPRGQGDPAWLGSAVDLDELGGVAGDAGLTIERVVNPGTQFCLILVRREGDRQ